MLISYVPRCEVKKHCEETYMGKNIQRNFNLFITFAMLYEYKCLNFTCSSPLWFNTDILALRAKCTVPLTKLEQTTPASVTWN